MVLQDKILKAGRIAGKCMHQHRKVIIGVVFSQKKGKFFSFERFDKADRLTYIAGFSKEPAVSIVFTLDKKGKITEFSLAALEVQQNEEQ